VEVVAAGAAESSLPPPQPARTIKSMTVRSAERMM
jgi:hypothetical protein